MGPYAQTVLPSDALGNSKAVAPLRPALDSSSQNLYPTMYPHMLVRVWAAYPSAPENQI